MKLFIPLIIILMQMSTAYDKQGEYFGSYGFLSYIIEYSNIISFILVSLGTLFLINKNSFTASKISNLTAIWYIFQLIISIKFMFYQMFSFGLASFFLTSLQLIFIISFTQYIKDQYQNPKLIMDQIVINFVVMFISINLYTLLFYPSSSINYSLRFHGVTSNPQHIAVFLSVLSPIAIIISINTPTWKSIITAAFIFIVTLLLLLAAGSRTALATYFILFILQAITTREGLYWKFSLISILSIIATLNAESIGKTFDSFFISRGNTRTETWTKGINYFIDSPFFGSGLNLGDRFLFVENTWISIVSSTGIVGIVLSFIALTNMIYIIVKSIIARQKYFRIEIILLFTGVFLACLFEALLLGVWKGHTFVILLLTHTYLSLNNIQLGRSVT